MRALKPFQFEYWFLFHENRRWRCAVCIISSASISVCRSRPFLVARLSSNDIWSLLCHQIMIREVIAAVAQVDISNALLISQMLNSNAFLAAGIRSNQIMFVVHPVIRITTFYFTSRYAELRYTAAVTHSEYCNKKTNLCRKLYAPLQHTCRYWQTMFTCHCSMSRLVSTGTQM